MTKDIETYNRTKKGWTTMCQLLMKEMNTHLPTAESKLWHGAPVWFIGGNPVAGYGVLKNCVQLLFWSGQSFDEPKLKPKGSFKAAEIQYTNLGQINTKELKRWLKKAKSIQWDYKNIIKRRGKLVRLTTKVANTDATKRKSSINSYIAAFPKTTQTILTTIRRLIRDTIPQATESISYKMPTFKLNDKNLVHFAAYKNHIGFYPTPSGIASFTKDFAQYKNAKGSVQFPLDQPIPYTLIKRVVQYRANEMRRNTKPSTT